MKAFWPLAAFSVALMMTACTSTQTAEAPAADTPKAHAPAATPLTERPGNIFNTRGRKAPASPAEDVKQKADTEETAPEIPAPAPTEEQQKAAEKLLQEAPAPVEPPAPAVAEPTPTLSGGLRMGSIIPQEEAASSTDAPPPGANTVELRGLRSPKLPSGLPMGIDGKLRGL